MLDGCALSGVLHRSLFGLASVFDTIHPQIRVTCCWCCCKTTDGWSEQDVTWGWDAFSVKLLVFGWCISVARNRLQIARCKQNSFSYFFLSRTINSKLLQLQCETCNLKSEFQQLLKVCFTSPYKICIKKWLKFKKVKIIFSRISQLSLNRKAELLHNLLDKQFYSKLENKCRIFEIKFSL